MELGFPASLDQIKQELERIRICVERATGLESQWNGNVVFVSNATFKGLKPFGCDIWIGDVFLDPEERWTTFIHELLHSVSAGYNRFDFEGHVGWEEGVVEKLQRVLREEILQELKLDVTAKMLAQLDQNHPFNHYIEAIEQVRRAFARKERDFYIDLLRIPIKNRYGHLLSLANSLAGIQRVETIRTLASSNTVLQQGRRNF